jgi:hypothetical protein
MYVALASGGAAICAELLIAPPIIDAQMRGASAWILWLIAAPLLLPVVAIGVWAKLDSRQHAVRPPAPEWHVIDEELPARRSPIELAMERRSAANIANAFVRWPTSLAGRPAVLTPRQRQDAADDAAWKRIQDGQGDQ